MIADLDYIHEVGEEEIKNLFTINKRKIDKSLKGKKSQDVRKLSDLLGKAIENENLDELREFWKYICTRHKRLKENLSRSEKKLLDNEIERLKQKDIYLLSDGEIEDYLPQGKINLEETIILVQDTSFEQWLINSWDNQMGELVSIIAQIIDASDQVPKIKALVQERILQLS